MPPRRAHWLDHLAAFASRSRRLFLHGWGDEATLDSVIATTRFDERHAPIAIDWQPRRYEAGIAIREGAFTSPVPGLPDAARRARVRFLLPREGRAPAKQPVYVVLASSGDEGFDVRTRLFRPLVRTRGIAALLLENAFYGGRRPAGQVGTAIRTVSDHLLMNLAMVEEARGLLDWLERAGHERLGVSGFSMGGSMAALVAAVVDRPLAAAIFAAGLSPVPVFTEGLLSRSIDYAELDEPRGAAEHARARIGRIFGAADLDRHPVPVRPDAAILVSGRRDGYVFTEQVEALHARWRGSELRWLDTGHAGALLFHGAHLCRAATDAMVRLGGT